MKRSDAILLMTLPAVVVLVGFWLLILGPKRQEASKLSDQVAGLQKEVDTQKQLATNAAQAKSSFPDNYKKVVELGRAVPQDDDTSSLFAEFSRLSAHAGVDFRSIALDSSAAGQAAPTAAPTLTPPAAGQPASGTPSGATAASTGAPAPATEASAALLPIGAAVGPAGFPVMPYKLAFSGDFFRVADFIHELDQMVSTKDGLVAVRGRLLTIDGFNLSEDTTHGFPNLTATFNVTTYLLPSDQGLLAGATPSGPGTAQPTSTTAPAPGTSPTATPAAVTTGTPQ